MRNHIEQTPRRDPSAGRQPCLAGDQPLADAAASTQTAIRVTGRTEGVVTTDGVHMNGLGNRLIANAVLGALGLDDAQVVKAEAAWKSR